MVANTVTAMPMRKGGPNQALFDNMRVQLQKLKLSRYIISDFSDGFVFAKLVLLAGSSWDKIGGQLPRNAKYWSQSRSNWT